MAATVEAAGGALARRPLVVHVLDHLVWGILAAILLVCSVTIEHFFQIYKDLEGKRVEILGWEKSEVAMRVIEESIVRYAEHYLSQGP